MDLTIPKLRPNDLAGSLRVLRVTTRELKGSRGHFRIPLDSRLDRCTPFLGVHLGPQLVTPLLHIVLHSTVIG
jgi:hypothetical protein